MGAAPDNLNRVEHVSRILQRTLISTRSYWKTVKARYKQESVFETEDCKDMELEDSNDWLLHSLVLRENFHRPSQLYMLLA